jgi:SAM-dependent methyltransferase
MKEERGGHDPPSLFKPPAFETGSSASRILSKYPKWVHNEAREFLEYALGQIPLSTSVVEFGARNINGSAREIIDCSHYVGVDINVGAGVDVQCDAAEFTPDKAPDLIICMETLEHTPNAREIVLNAGKILTDGGHLIVTCATDPRPPHSASGIHADGGFGPLPGEFYQNVSPDDLCQWAFEAGFVVLDRKTRRDCGDTYLLAVKTGDVPL